MIPKLSRGRSFKKLADYLTHDKRELLDDGVSWSVDSADRVGFVETLNFHEDMPDGDARAAARQMAFTWQHREQLKAAARDGQKQHGGAAKGPPVHHTSLAWAKGQTVDAGEMMRTAASYIEAQGLTGHQAIIVQHTDTAHPHIHVMVNLVHPVTGKQADPFRDQQKAQAWARAYEKQQGQVFCHDREAKHAAIDKTRRSPPTPERAAFNGKATGEAGKPPARPASTRPARPVPYHVWQAQQQARSEAERTAAHQVKAGLSGRYRDMRASHEAGYQARQQETSQARADAQGGRNAIYEKYASALDAIYRPPPGPKEAAPERTAWANVAQRLAERRNAFDRRESSALGRFQNARDLAKGAGLFRVLRLAINPTERRKLFEREQRTTQAKLMPRGPERAARAPFQPKTPDLPYKRAASLKAMRTAELADHARKQAAGAASMEARHQFQRQAEQGQRDAFKADAKQAWEAHRQAFARQEAKEQDNARPAAAEHTAAPRTAAAEQATTPEAQKADQFGRSRDRQPRQARSTAGTAAGGDRQSADTPDQERKADQFGRSRDRKPRQPRAGRGMAQAEQQGGQQASPNRQATGKGSAEAENQPVEAVEAFDRANTPPAAPEATHAPESGQGEAAELDAARAARISALHDAEAARAQDSSRDHDTGRTMGR